MGRKRAQAIDPTYNKTLYCTRHEIIPPPAGRRFQARYSVTRVVPTTAPRDSHRRHISNAALLGTVNSSGLSTLSCGVFGQLSTRYFQRRPPRDCHFTLLAVENQALKISPGGGGYLVSITMHKNPVHTHTDEKKHLSRQYTAPLEHHRGAAQKEPQKANGPS